MGPGLVLIRVGTILPVAVKAASRRLRHSWSSCATAWTGTGFAPTSPSTLSRSSSCSPTAIQAKECATTMTWSLSGTRVSLR
uniref:Putative secreted protein n=1 Tax=Anopheles triannulatus TaxID=58253 RepID=A0A2M4B643_9DIPT